MASRQELLSSISPQMRLDKSFFMKVYGYELTWPGFAEEALARLEILGCSRAREYYACIVVEYEHNHEKELKRAAEWYGKQDFRRKEVKKPRNIQEAEQVNQLTKSELKELCKRLLKEGVIKSPEQFVTVVTQDQ